MNTNININTSLAKKPIYCKFVEHCDLVGFKTYQDMVTMLKAKADAFIGEVESSAHEEFLKIEKYTFGKTYTDYSEDGWQTTGMGSRFNIKYKPDGYNIVYGLFVVNEFTINELLENRQRSDLKINPENVALMLEHELIMYRGMCQDDSRLANTGVSTGRISTNQHHGYVVYIAIKLAFNDALFKNRVYKNYDLTNKLPHIQSLRDCSSNNGGSNFTGCEFQSFSNLNGKLVAPWLYTKRVEDLPFYTINSSMEMKNPPLYNIYYDFI